MISMALATYFCIFLKVNRVYFMCSKRVEMRFYVIVTKFRSAFDMPLFSFKSCTFLNFQNPFWVDGNDKDQLLFYSKD